MAIIEVRAGVATTAGSLQDAWCSRWDHSCDSCTACRFLLFEVVAGTAVARIAAGEELVVLRRKAGHRSSA
jgi:hypothetical protein